MLGFAEEFEALRHSEAELELLGFGKHLLRGISRSFLRIDVLLGFAEAF
jgi:hypothetical protein